LFVLAGGVFTPVDLTMADEYGGGSAGFGKATGEEGPERKLSSFAAVGTRGLPRSVNLRSGQRDYHIYIAGRSIRP
jgi:hypothetical protein